MVQIRTFGLFYLAVISVFVDFVHSAKIESVTDSLGEQSRHSIVKDTLNSANGVYRDKEKAMRLGTNSTILITVLSANQHGARYIMLLKNWLCYASQNGFEPVIYILPSEENTTTFTMQVQELRESGIDSHFLSYPTELFRKILARKKTQIMRRPNRADYEGIVPSFNHFGALVMIIPMLEVLEMGYNCIYLDLDIASVVDPVPVIVKSTADFTVSLELRSCIFPSLIEFGEHWDWEAAEPNTGVFYGRSTAHGITLYYRWLQKLIDEQFVNDQVVLKYSQLGARLSFSCNEKLASLDNNVAFQNKRANSDKNASTTPTICFLNEFQFQNGKMINHCATGLLGGSSTDYTIAMYSNGFRNETHEEADSERLITPVTAHLNYCKDKIIDLIRLGLWLPHQGDIYRCKSYDVQKTAFVGRNWSRELRTAGADVERAKEKIINGSSIMFHGDKTVFLLADGFLRAFPDAVTFERMGFDWRKIVHMRHYAFYNLWPIGSLLPSLSW